MSEQKIDVTIGAKIDELLNGLRGATSAVAGATQQMGSSLEGVGNIAEMVRSRLVVATAAFAALAAGVNSGINAVLDMTADARALSNALGITAEEANELNVALGNVHLEAEVYITASRQLTRQLNTNEEAFGRMGVATRDASGNLRPMQAILQDSAAALMEYKAGADRNTMAQQLMGRSFEDVLKIAKLTPEVFEGARQEIADFGKQLDPAEVEEYRGAMENVGDVFEGLRVVVGQAVMPIMTRLGNWFGSIGPNLVTAFRVAVASLVTAFYALATGVEVVWQIIAGFVEGAVVLFAGLLDAWIGLQNLDGTRMKDALSKTLDSMSDIASKRFGNIAEASQNARDQVAKQWAGVMGDSMGQDAGPQGGRGSKSARDIKGKDKPAEVKDTYSAAFEAELAALRLKYARENGLREMSKQQEADFWASKLAIVEGNVPALANVRRKMAEAQLAYDRKAYGETLALSGLEIQATRDRSLAQLESEQQAAAQALAARQITNEQKLLLDADFEARRFAIESTALDSRLKLAELSPDNPVAYAQLLAEKERLEAEHLARLNEMRGASALEQNASTLAIQDGLTSMFEQGFSRMLDGTLKFGDALRQVWGQIAAIFVRELITKKVAAWAAGQTMQTAATVTGVAARTAAEAAGASASVGITAATAVKNIMANAYAAMAGAWQAMVSIPYIGPALGVAAGAAAFAGVSALVGKVKSARGGYDIPAGVNPMTQLHEEEMVLPKEQANAVRDMANGGGSGGGNITIHALDAASIKRLFMDNGAALAESIRRQARNGSQIPT